MCLWCVFLCTEPVRLAGDQVPTEALRPPVEAHQSLEDQPRGEVEVGENDNTGEFLVHVFSFTMETVTQYDQPISASCRQKQRRHGVGHFVPCSVPVVDLF